MTRSLWKLSLAMLLGWSCAAWGLAAEDKAKPTEKPKAEAKKSDPAKPAETKKAPDAKPAAPAK